jgi:hypothetical protein
MQLVDCGPYWSGAQQTPLAQSAASLHETSTPEQLPALYGSHVSPPLPFEQQYWVAVLQEALPQGTMPGSHAAPPSGTWQVDPPLLPPSPPLLPPSETLPELPPSALAPVLLPLLPPPSSPEEPLELPPKPPLELLPPPPSLALFTALLLLLPQCASSIGPATTTDARPVSQGHVAVELLIVPSLAVRLAPATPMRPSGAIRMRCSMRARLDLASRRVRAHWSYARFRASQIFPPRHRGRGHQAMA